MTASRQPWTANGKNLKDADGNVIAMFKDENDIDIVIEQQRTIATMKKALVEIQATLETIDDL